MIIYAICLVLGLMFMLISAFLGHLFGGHDSIGTGGHADAGFDSDGVPGVSFFSPTVLASFVTAFGAFGMLYSEIPATQSIWLNAPLAFVSGLVIALLLLWGMNKIFHSTESSSEGRVAKLIGQTAAIVSPIPANGVGEISYEQAGSRFTAPAREEKGGAVASGETVKITRIVGSQFYVEQHS
jgi:membrane protein implicated in regulation of membrane protease activity